MGARQRAGNGTTYLTALSSPLWSSLIPEGNVFLDDAGGGDGCVVETLPEEGSLLLAGGLPRTPGPQHHRHRCAQGLYDAR
jgi:hypothetical protein